MKNIFGKTDIYLPFFADDDERWVAWSVIACDQHTSEPSYWEETERTAAGHPSTLSLILPEAYLGTDKEKEKKNAIKKSGKSFDERLLKKYESSMVYVERTLESGMIRRGLVGAVDLDSYDYEKGSTPEIRPTEGTVKERIPPRVAVRRESVWEASHVMLFCECRELFDMLTSSKDHMKILYDFDLMQGGGHITGRLVSGEILSRAEEMISSYEKDRRASGVMTYGVGDGNHSLASAKAYCEELKKNGQPVGGAVSALVELVPITERSIVFEPIYKYVAGIDENEFLSFIKKQTSGEDGASVTAYYNGTEETFEVSLTDGEPVCGALQRAIDLYTGENGGVCDYIHGKENLLSLAEKGGVGFVFDGIDKSELFPYVTAHGVLPRKAFSMGEASEKRYYTELRKLKY